MGRYITHVISLQRVSVPLPMLLIWHFARVLLWGGFFLMVAVIAI